MCTIHMATSISVQSKKWPVSILSYLQAVTVESIRNTLNIAGINTSQALIETAASSSSHG